VRAWRFSFNRKNCFDVETARRMELRGGHERAPLSTIAAMIVALFVVFSCW
jgi:hypothetical protein